jgi:IS5 family transposase
VLFENEAVKAGRTPEGWEKKPAKNAQKDKEARWTKKGGQSFYGYKKVPRYFTWVA